MNELVIINGRIIDPINGIDGEHTVVVHNGKIAAIEKGEKQKNQSGAKVIDAKGMIISPGFVDIHTHLRDPGFEYKEDIESGSKSAVAGGFTTICCMPNTDPVNDNAGVSEYIIKRSREVGLANIIPIGAISKGLKGEAMADVGNQAAVGVAALSDDGRPVMNSLLLRRSAEFASSFELPIIDHCEDLNLTKNGVMHEGAVSTELGLSTMPSAAEEAHVARDIALSKLTGAHFHITHMSSAGSVELIRTAKKKKINITCDVTPHHLTLTDEAVRGYNTNFKVNPPLRSEADVKELLKGLIDGTIDAIATDHAPHGIIDKELAFDSAAFGIIGLETALPVVLKLVHEKKVSLKRMAELLTSGMNILRGDYSQGLKKGAVADITIFDPEEKVTINAKSFYSKGRNTPFDSWKLKGKVRYTIVGGKLVFDDQKGISSTLGW